MASSDTLYYADYIVLFIGRPTYDGWVGGLLGHAVLCRLFGIVYWYAHLWRMGRPFFNVFKTKITVLYEYVKIQFVPHRKHIVHSLVRQPMNAV